MPSARRVAGENYNLLSAKTVGREERVTVTIINVFEAPKDWKSPLIAKIVPVMKKDHVALNKTSVNKLIELIDDDYSKWPGYDVTLEVQQYDDFDPGFVVVAAAKTKRRMP